MQAAVDAGDRRAFAQDGTERLRKTHQRFPGYFDYDQLYNLARDPLEQRNVAANPNQRKRLAAMRAVLSEHLAGSPSAFGEFHDPSASSSDD